MTATTATAQKKSIDKPDEVIEFAKGRIEALRIGETEVYRATLEPGWRWSEHVKPVAQTESCDLPHATYLVAGSLRVRMDDGTELEASAGDLLVIPPGHDAWVTGDEACVTVDFGGEDADFGKPRS